MYVLINLRSLFDAWGYYLLTQKIARLAIADDDRSTRFGDDDDYSTQSSEEAWIGIDIEDIYVQNPIMLMRSENIASTNDNQ